MGLRPVTVTGRRSNAWMKSLESRRMLSVAIPSLRATPPTAMPTTIQIPATAATDPWQAVPAVNFSTINIAQFTDSELPLVQPLYWFSTVANSVLEAPSGSLPRGFINIKVWRNPQDNTQYNARVLENNIAFAYFYSQNRPWNPYYGNVQVKNRLEAILDLWASMQNTSGGSNDGTWTEYFSSNWSLAPTSFGLRTIVRTLEYLQDGPPIDAGVKQRVVDATIRGLRALLKTNNWLSTPRSTARRWSSPISFRNTPRSLKAISTCACPNPSASIKARPSICMKRRGRILITRCACTRS
jgi:hypothetical protein